MAAHGCTGIPCKICGFGMLARPTWTDKDFNEALGDLEEECLTQKAMAEHFKTYGKHGPVMVSCPCKRCSPVIL